MEFAEIKDQEDWQENLLDESNGVKLFERGVGVYTLSYTENGRAHEPVFLDWNQAVAQFENLARYPVSEFTPFVCRKCSELIASPEQQFSPCKGE